MNRCLDDNLLVALVEGLPSSQEHAEIEAHLDTCSTCRPATVARRMARLDEGLEDLAAATEGLARARGPEHRDVLDVRIAHAQALVAAERWKQAIRVADPCVTASLHRPEALRYHASCLQLMGTALHGGEGPGAALPVLEQALTAAEGLDRGDSLLAAAARFELARARIAQGRHDERTLDLVERALGVYRATSAFEDVTAQLETMLAQLRPPP
jgi:hypothetical protein